MARHRRPERFPVWGLNERGSHSVTRGGNASDKQRYLSPAGPEDETTTGKREEDTPVQAPQVMERVLERRNLFRALHQVTRNKGGPGIDGMTVEGLPGHLKKHWPRIKAELISGKYKPQPVKRVEIPKPGGGFRKLGVPTVADRLIQQALMQVLQEQWDSTFSRNSYGFRPKRSAHQAVAGAQGYLGSALFLDSRLPPGGRTGVGSARTSLTCSSRGCGD